MESKELTAHVTNKAVALIRAIHNPPIGAKEFSGGFCPERCDAILFDSGSSYMIETKISRSDFLADFKKDHRQEGRGVGNYRYYACPTGLIKPEELPDKWGLIYVSDNKKDRAQMIVGYGGSIPKLGQSGLWKYQKEHEFHGTKTPETINDMDRFWEHPDYPRNKFRFDSCDYERNFLFAIATRYKQQKFMDNML